MLQVFESHAECLSPYLFTLYAFPHLEEIAVRVKQRLGKDAVPMVSRYAGLSYCVIGHFLEVFLHICTYLPLFRQIAETIQYTICLHVFFTDLFFYRFVQLDKNVVERRNYRSRRIWTKLLSQKILRIDCVAVRFHINYSQQPYSLLLALAQVMPVLSSFSSPCCMFIQFAHELEHSCAC